MYTHALGDKFSSDYNIMLLRNYCDSWKSQGKWLTHRKCIIKVVKSIIMLRYKKMFKGKLVMLEGVASQLVYKNDKLIGYL